MPGDRWNLRARLILSGPWLALLAIPLLVNGLLWHLLVRPEQATLQSLRDAHTLTALRPKLEALLAESHQLVTEWQRTSFSAGDPSTPMQTIQRVAGLHRVKIEQITAMGQAAAQAPTGQTQSSPVPGYTTMPIELEVIGRFSKLAHWMSAIESQAGLQVDSWMITPGTGSNNAHRLHVALTALLRAT